MNKDMQKVKEVAENLGWSVTECNDGITIGKHSPANQDFSIDIDTNNLEELVEEIREKCDNYDCSEEAYLWLDNTGHGINGAPYDMKDVYEDMAACLEILKELLSELEKLV